MSTTVDIKCPKCGDVVFCDTRTPLWVLAWLQRVSFRAECDKCGFKKTYRLVSAECASRMMEQGERLKREKWPELYVATDPDPRDSDTAP